MSALVILIAAALFIGAASTATNYVGYMKVADAAAEAHQLTNPSVGNLNE